MIALIAALLFLVGAIVAEVAGEFLTLGPVTWIALGLVLLALHVGGMAWLDGRRR